MKKTAIQRALAALSVVLALTLFSCNPDKPKPSPGPSATPIGSYHFDNAEYPLVSGKYSTDGRYTNLIFASQNISGETVKSYFTLSLKTWLVETGEPVQAETISHNDDYIFVYETPSVYYPDYKRVTGKIHIKHTAENHFTISLDLALNDGKPFKFDFDGELTSLGAI